MMAGNPPSYFGNDWLNVELFGAAGDGFTDCTAAIQAALSAAIPGQQVVYIPSGTFKLSRAVTAPAGVLWYLAGTLTGHTITGGTVVNFGGVPGVGVTDWINVTAAPYKADPTGAGDSTTAFQSALNTLAAASGGVLYVPAGTYKITATLTWTSANSLVVAGAGEDATQINRASATAPFHTFDVQNVTGGGVTVRDLNIMNTVNAGSFADDQVGLYFSGCNRVRLQNVHINSTGNRVNIAVELNNCNTSSIIACDLRGYVNALLINGGTAIVDCVATQFFTNNGSGQANAGSIAMIGPNAATVHITNCITNGGDHGLVLQGGSPDAFVFINDLEINNTHGHAVVLNTGAQFWANQLWCSNQSIANNEAPYDAVHVAATYTGWAVLDNCTFQHYSGYGVYLGGGQSYWIANSSFSGCCGNASNTTDDIHVVTGVSEVTIIGNHFDVEPFNTGFTPRAGVYIESGVTDYQVRDNIFSASVWGTAACVDANTAPQRLAFKNNRHGFDYKDAGSTQAIGSFSTAETIVAQIQVDPQDLLSGATFKLTLFGQYTNGTGGITNTIRVRAGTAGTTADQQLCSTTITSNGSTSGSANVVLDGQIQLTAPGTSGTGKAWFRSTQAAAGFAAAGVAFATPSLTSWNTTTSVWLEVTFLTGNATNTMVVTMATLEKVS